MVASVVISFQSRQWRLAESQRKQPEVVHRFESARVEPRGGDRDREDLDRLGAPLDLNRTQ